MAATLLDRFRWEVRLEGKAIQAVLLTCPRCFAPLTLWDECAPGASYSIDRLGGVSPPIRCPNKGCKFRELVVLDGWEHGELVGWRLT